MTVIGAINLKGTATLTAKPKLIEAISETRIDVFTLDVIAGQGEGTTVFGRVYEDGLGAIRARWGLRRRLRLPPRRCRIHHDEGPQTRSRDSPTRRRPRESSSRWPWACRWNAVAPYT